MNGRDTGTAGASTEHEGQSPPPAKLPAWRSQPVAEEAPVLTVDGELMRDLAARAIAAGSNGMTKVGVAAARHGEGATTIARSLAACLTANFGQRVVLVEANQRSPSLREVCGLPPGAGLAEVLSGRASLEAALRMSRSAGKMLVLPASLSPMGNPAAYPAGALQNLVAELFFYADALVFDLPPLLPYPDTLAIAGVLDGMALVVRAGRATRGDCAKALGALQGAAIPVLGAVLNREKSLVPAFLARRR